MDEALFITVLLLLTVSVLACVALARRRLHGFSGLPVLGFTIVMGGTLMPPWYAVLTGNREPFLFGYPVETWSLGLALDLVFCLACALGLMYTTKHRMAIAVNSVNKCRRIPHPWWLLLAIFLAALGAQYLTSGQWSNAGYETAGRYVKTSLQDPSVTLGGMERFFDAFIATPAAFFLVLIKKKPSGLAPRLIAVALGLAYVAPKLLETTVYGSRGYLFSVVFLVTAISVYNRQPLRACALTVLLVLAIAAFSGAIRAYRENSVRFTALTNEEKLQLLLAYVQESWSPETGFDAIVKNFLLRFDDGIDGGILAGAAEASGNYAGIRPFMGSALAPVPRFFWYAKPVPLSSTDSVMGTPAYLVGALRNMPWNNAGVSISGVAFWQFSWAGVVITGFVSGVLLTILSYLAKRGGVFGFYVFLVVASETSCRLMTSLDDWLQIVLRAVIPLYLVARLYTFCLHNTHHASRVHCYPDVQPSAVDS